MARNCSRDGGRADPTRADARRGQEDTLCGRRPPLRERLEHLAAAGDATKRSTEPLVSARAQGLGGKKSKNSTRAQNILTNRCFRGAFLFSSS